MNKIVFAGKDKKGKSKKKMEVVVVELCLLLDLECLGWGGCW